MLEKKKDFTVSAYVMVSAKYIFSFMKVILILFSFDVGKERR